MLKPILLLFASFIFAGLTKAQVNYFREKGTSISVLGGFSDLNPGESYSGALAIVVKSLEFGLEYSKVDLNYDEGNDSHGVTSGVIFPYIETRILRTRTIGLSAGAGYLHFVDLIAPPVFPIYLTFVLDLAANNSGFTLIPDITLMKPLQFSSFSSYYDSDAAASIGVMFINRNETGTSFFMRPGISKGFNSSPLSISLSAGLIFRKD